MIKVEQLSFGWGGVPLMKDIDFTVERGDVFIILGGSGCGKSTLLRQLVGLAKPMSGTIEIEGLGAPKIGYGPPAFGVMFQSGALFGSLTLAENVALPLRTWTDLDDDAVDAIVRSKLDLVSLGGFENHLPAEISGGMKKRAAVARAMAFEPELLFLDEPSAGLDPITSAEFDQLVLTLNKHLGLTLVIVTHELASLLDIGTNCIMLDKQTRGIIARGNPRTLRDESTQPFVSSFFHRRPMQEDGK